MGDLFEMVGGPMDGEQRPAPTELMNPGQLPAMAFGDHAYCFTDLNGKTGWHYIGLIKWTPEEIERRKRGDA